MNIIGLSAFYHESACCLLQGGRLVAAAAEERFTRVKHDARLPVQAYRYCLRAGGNLMPGDIDCLAYYEMPVKKVERQRWSGRVGPSDRLLDQDPERLIRDNLGYDGPILYFDHHLSHAASAFYYSGFDESAILTVDGVGEWATTTYGRGLLDDIDIFEEVHFPHSLGLLYATVTAYLGFRVNSGEYKVMGLAPYGRPRYLDQMRQLIKTGPAGQFSLDMTYFDFVAGERMFSQALVDLLGKRPRRPEEPLLPFHQDIARSLQDLLEEIVLEKVKYLAGRVESPNLCLAGGVALNCVANGRIHREGPFEKVFIQPAAGDAGGCLGAAALAHRQLNGHRHTHQAQSHVYVGPSIGDRGRDSREIATLLDATGIEALDFRGREKALLADVSGRLAQNQVTGWFQGAMEFGPRALGNRSILANPMDPEMGHRINQRVKKRESFRPFAPSVLLDQAHEHFELDYPSPFMLETCQVISPLPLPAITHVDSSARPQTVDPAANPRFAGLIQAFFKQTGCPILLNTSLNIRGEPIVCSPVDALICMVRANLDVLVLGDFLIERSMLAPDLDTLLKSWETKPRPAFDDGRSAVEESLYTFV